MPSAMLPPRHAWMVMMALFVIGTGGVIYYASSILWRQDVIADMETTLKAGDSFAVERNGTTWWQASPGWRLLEVSFTVQYRDATGVCHYHGTWSLLPYRRISWWTY